VTETNPQTGTAPSTASPSAPASTLKEIERNHILAVLRQTGGVIEGPKGAARILDLHPNTLRHRINKLGIKPTHIISYPHNHTHHTPPPNMGVPFLHFPPPGPPVALSIIKSTENF